MSAPRLFPETPIGDFYERVAAFAAFRGCTLWGAQVVISSNRDVYEVSVKNLTDECEKQIYAYLYPKGPA
jgi:hypothetical protein